MLQPYFRPVEIDDFKKIKQMLEQTWHYSELFDDKKMTDVFLNFFLGHTLHHSSYGQVAELNGEVVGFIFGHVQNQVPKMRMLQIDLEDSLMKVLKASTADQNAMADYLDTTFKSYKKMMNKTKRQYDSSIELFIVDKKARGHRIGSTLLNNLEQTFIGSKAQNIYLFTDTDCNFKFYEHKKFNRVSELTPQASFDLGLNSFTYFMYEKEFEG